MPSNRDQRSSSVNSTLPTNNNKITKRRKTSTSGDYVDWRTPELQLENIKFCALLKAAPCIYDHEHENFGNQKAVDAAWMTIAERWGQTVTVCKARYRSLRTAYGVYVAALKKDKGANSVKPYYLHKHMDFLKPFYSNRSGRKPPKSRRETIIEVLSDDSNDCTMSAVDNDSRLEETNNTFDLEDCDGEDGSTDYGLPSEVRRTRKRTASVLTENFNVRQRLISTSTIQYDTTELDRENATEFEREDSTTVPEREDTTELEREDAIDLEPPEETTQLEPSSDAQHDINQMEDKKFLNCILYVMQDMNKRQKHIFKSKIWENVHTVLDSDADYPTNRSKTCAEAKNARENKNHSDSETVVQQMMHGIARLNECELRAMQRLIQQREQEIQSHPNIMVAIPGHNDNNNVICNYATNAADLQQAPRLSSPYSIKQEPTSTDMYI